MKRKYSAVGYDYGRNVRVRGNTYVTPPPVYGPITLQTHLQRQRLDAINRRKASQNKRTGGLMGLELKYKDNTLAATALDDAWLHINPSATVMLTGTGQGDGPGEHDGYKQVTKSLFIKGEIRVGGAVTQASMPLGFNTRILLVEDCQVNGALPSIDDVIMQVTGPTLPIDAFQKIENTFRFKILKEKVIPFNFQNVTAGAATTFAWPTVNKKFKMKYIWKDGMETRYINTTNIIGNITNRTVYLIACCDNIGAAPTIGYNARCRFVG